MMNVQLRHHIAEGGNIQFLGIKLTRQNGGSQVGLTAVLSALLGREFKKLSQARLTWHKNQPRILAIIQ